MEKAYENVDFLASREARSLRILSEYLEPQEPLTVWAELPAWPAVISAARR